MSRVQPDPMIQQLRAMRAGDIAFARGQVAAILVGVAPVAAPLPVANISIPTPVATPTQNPPDATPSETTTPPVVAPTTLLSQDSTPSISLSAASESLVTIDGPFDPGTISVTVGKGTSVV